jgi:hypothetical protein
MKDDIASRMYPAQILRVVAEEKMMPPTPDPAAAIPWAKLLFLLNH